jgi:hypothetical protein
MNLYSSPLVVYASGMTLMSSSLFAFPPRNQRRGVIPPLTLRAVEVQDVAGRGQFHGVAVWARVCQSMASTHACRFGKARHA